MVSEVRILNVSKGFRGIPALINVSLTARSGLITCIRGPSGSGKSTLLRIMAGLLRPDSGFVYYDNTELYTNPTDEVLRVISYVPQDDLLITSLSIRDNIDLALRVQGIGRAERERRITDIARALGITNALSKRPMEVSGGERRRASIAIALARDHQVLIMDEPSNSLDIDNINRLIELIRGDASMGTVIVVATHDDYLARYCNVTYSIRSGVLYAPSVDVVNY